jgi:hypothetical protein
VGDVNGSNTPINKEETFVGIDKHPAIVLAEINTVGDLPVYAEIPDAFNSISLILRYNPSTVRIMEVKENAGNPATNVLEYGSFSFQGAYVYNIDLVNGFVPKGKISHLSEEDYTGAGSCWWNGEKYIERIIYIDDTLYTLSKGMIKANSIADLQEINSLEIE